MQINFGLITPHAFHDSIIHIGSYSLAGSQPFNTRHKLTRKVVKILQILLYELVLSLQHLLHHLNIKHFSITSGKARKT